MSSFKRPSRKEDLPDFLSLTEDLSPLALPLTLSAKTIPNRICYQPMEGCDGTEAGSPGELTRRRYLRFARGGAGLIWFEATAVVPEGKANPRQMYLSEETLPDFQRLVEEIKETCLRENGFLPVVVCQLTHSGRWSKPYGAPAPRIAYSKPIFEGETPLPSSAILSDDELSRLPEAYAASAELAEKAGFDGADVKACHGYLLSELLNAYLRPGKYGGSRENRFRLLMEATEAVRAATKQEFLLASRFNAYDGYPHPFGMGDSGQAGVPDFTEAALLAVGLAERGVSLLNVTMGCPYTNHEVNRPTVKAQTEAPYDSIRRMLAGAKAVKAAVGSPAVVVSGLSFLGKFAPHVSAEGIRRGDYDLAGFGRQTFSYPDLARDLLETGAMKEKNLCLTCGKCTELMRNRMTPGCVIYDPVYTKLYQTLG